MTDNDRIDKSKKRTLTDYLSGISKERGLSLRSMSLQAGLSPGTVHSIISSKNIPSLYSLNQLADYLGVKRQYLWEMAGLIEYNEQEGKKEKANPRLTYLCEKVISLPKPAQELIFKVVENLVNYHLEDETPLIQLSNIDEES